MPNEKCLCDFVLRYVRNEPYGVTIDDIRAFLDDFSNSDKERSVNILAQLLTFLCASGRLDKAGARFCVPENRGNLAPGGHARSHSLDRHLPQPSYTGRPALQPVNGHHQPLGLYQDQNVAPSQEVLPESPKGSAKHIITPPNGLPFEPRRLSSAMKRPSSVVHVAGHQPRLWVGSDSGVFRCRPDGARLKLGGEVKAGTRCLGLAYWAHMRKVIAFVDGACEADRRRGRQELEICIIEEQKPTQSFFTIDQSQWGPALGRPQAIALSEQSRRLFVSSAVETQAKPPPSVGYASSKKPAVTTTALVLRLNLEDLDQGRLRATELLKRPSTGIGPVAVSDLHKVFAVGLWSEKEKVEERRLHSVEVFNFEGAALRQVASGSRAEVYRLGSVFRPRALCFGDDGRELYVADEGMRVQAFALDPKEPLKAKTLLQIPGAEPELSDLSGLGTDGTGTLFAVGHRPLHEPTAALPHSDSDARLYKVSLPNQI